MLASLKSEFRKLRTVRSTYFIALCCAALIVLFAFWVNGFKASAIQLHDATFLANQTRQAIMAVGLIGALVVTLLVTHEYRYNTVMYTLTASNNRTKTLLAKFIAVSGYAVLFSVVMGLFSPVVSILGVHLAGHTMVAQHVDWWPLIWQTLFVGWGYAMLAFIFAVIIRVQVGAIVALFVIPLIVEPILQQLLKHQGRYLPFNALQSVVVGNTGSDPSFKPLSPTHAALTFLVYAGIGLVVSWILFARRDAN